MLMLSDAALSLVPLLWSHNIQVKKIANEGNLKQNHAWLQSLIIHWIGWIGIVHEKLSNLLKMYTRFNQYCVRSFTNTDNLSLD